MCLLLDTTVYAIVVMHYYMYVLSRQLYIQLREKVILFDTRLCVE